LKIILALISLLILALLGSHSIRSRWKLPTPVRRLFDNALIFIGVGVAIGPAGVNLIGDDALEKLGPIIVISLGWIGFLFGVHLEWRRMRRLTSRIWMAAMGQAALTVGLVFFATYWFFHTWMPTTAQLPAALAATIALAACAGGTAPNTVFQLGGRPRFVGEIAQSLRIIAVIDDLPGLLLFGVFFSFFPGSFGADAAFWPGVAWLGMTVMLGVLFGLLLKSLLVLARGEQAVWVAVFGVISLASGLASYLNLSPIFVGAIAGVTFANISGQKETVYEVLASSETTIYVLFLVLVGCLWSFDTMYLLPLVLLYVGARTLGKVVGVGVGYRLLGAPVGRERLGGLGLLGQGGIAIALAVNYARVFTSNVSSLVLTALIFGVLINEVLGPVLATIPFGAGRGGRR